MLLFCTVTDKKYLQKGLALFKSLNNTCRRRFTLHWLCLDDETYDTLVYMNFRDVRPYKLAEVLKWDHSFSRAKELGKSNYGEEYDNFCWRSVPCFIEFLLSILLRNDGDTLFPEAECPLIYCDSDIFFYQNPEIIIDIVGNKSVGIHTHRFGGPFDDKKDNGWYNVGVMVFNRNYVGRAVAGTWKTWVLSPGCSLYPKYGTCGDQKWLELFIPTYGKDNICVFDEEGDCFHLAPWNCNHLQHAGTGQVIENGKQKPVVFFHFSHFRMEGDTWYDCNKDEWHPARDPNIYPYYENYFQTIKGLKMVPGELP